MHRIVPIAEILPILEVAFDNIAAHRIHLIDEHVRQTTEFHDKKRRNSWLVKLGLKKYVEFTTADTVAMLKKLGGGWYQHSVNKCWFIEDLAILNKLKKLCRITKEESTVHIDGLTAEVIDDWVNYTTGKRMPMYRYDD